VGSRDLDHSSESKRAVSSAKSGSPAGKADGAAFDAHPKDAMAAAKMVSSRITAIRAPLAMRLPSSMPPLEVAGVFRAVRPTAATY